MFERGKQRRKELKNELVISLGDANCAKNGEKIVSCPRRANGQGVGCFWEGRGGKEKKRVKLAMTGK